MKIFIEIKTKQQLCVNDQITFIYNSEGTVSGYYHYVRKYIFVKRNKTGSNVLGTTKLTSGYIIILCFKINYTQYLSI